MNILKMFFLLLVTPSSFATGIAVPEGAILGDHSNTEKIQQIQISNVSLANYIYYSDKSDSWSKPYPVFFQDGQIKNPRERNNGKAKVDAERSYCKIYLDLPSIKSAANFNKEKSEVDAGTRLFSGNITLASGYGHYSISGTGNDVEQTNDFYKTEKDTGEVTKATCVNFSNDRFSVKEFRAAFGTYGDVFYP